ncbi:MAG: hypothetical protein WC592_07810, partial [Candidatus Omnitrophota bacterium]
KWPFGRLRAILSERSESKYGIFAICGWINAGMMAIYQELVDIWLDLSLVNGLVGNKPKK